MKKSTLKEVREEYNRIKKEKENLISYRNELIELAENEKVKRFLELTELVDKDYIGLSEEVMIMMAYQKVSEVFVEEDVNSNHIMIFMGSYIKNDSREQNDEYMTYERDPNTTFRLYMDLETKKCFHVDKDKCQEFEAEHLALYLPISEYTEQEYYKKYIELQKWFKTQLIHHSQLDVIKELQEKYEKKYKKIYPYFHKIDTIDNLPIDDYVKTHSANGFIENYCLSQEEFMRVKLYRKQENFR